MQYISIFDAKKDVTLEEIEKERDEWLAKGKEKLFHKKCHSINRYEVLGIFPLKIIFVIDTDNPTVLNLLSHHFGHGWNSITYPVTHREIYEALEEDRSIIGG